MPFKPKPFHLLSLSLLIVSCGGSDSKLLAPSTSVAASTTTTSTPTQASTQPASQTATQAENIRITLTGSVGDGPIVGASVDIVDSQGRILASAVTDSQAKYTASVVIQENGEVRIRARGGLDLVSGQAPDFDLSSTILLDTETIDPIANVSLLTSLIYQSAQCLAGENRFDRAKQAIISNSSFGLVEFDAQTNWITAEQAPLVLVANEALGEITRRLAARIDGDEPIDTFRRLACDIADGPIDGSAGFSVRQATLANAVQATVLTETLQNQLRVNGDRATSSMNDALRTLFPTGTPNVNRLDWHPALVDQLRQSLLALTSVSNEPALYDLAALLDSTAPNELTEVLTSSNFQSAREIAQLTDTINALPSAQTASFSNSSVATSTTTDSPPINTAPASNSQPNTSQSDAATNSAVTTSSSATAPSPGNNSQSNASQGNAVINSAVAASPITNDSPAPTNAGSNNNSQSNATQGAPATNTNVLSLTIDDPWVPRNGQTTLRWSAPSSASCAASGAWQGNKASAGTFVVSSTTQDQPFTLTCDQAGVQNAETVTLRIRQANLHWSRPTLNTDGSPLTDLTGYRIHYGTRPSEYSQTVTVDGPNTINHRIDLTPGTYYFSLTSVNAQGSNSPFASEQSKTIQ